MVEREGSRLSLCCTTDLVSEFPWKSVAVYVVYHNLLIIFSFLSFSNYSVGSTTDLVSATNLLSFSRNKNP